MKIVVIGAGYVGLSMAVLLAKKNEVTLIDTNKEKVELLAKGISPIKDSLIEKYLKTNMRVCSEYNENDIMDAEIFILAVPTNSDKNKDLDVGILNSIFERTTALNNSALYVIKSTIPFGYTDSVKKNYKIKNIIFSPEFSREGYSVYDNLFPDRIIFGYDTINKSLLDKFVNVILDMTQKHNPNILFVTTKEAELIKLISNTYLAMRVAFFNEIDSFTLEHNLNSKNIIQGVCLDHRIGDHYNNPSFGYGGYCLPKDTMQLENIFSFNAPLINSITMSNSQRKKIIAEYLNKTNAKTIGIYKLSMKKNSDNNRNSAILDIIRNLKISNIIIYDSTIKNSEFEGHKVVNDLLEFKKNADIIVANRMDKDLFDVKTKVFTRDLFFDN